jgi:hypothetical protein
VIRTDPRSRKAFRKLFLACYRIIGACASVPQIGGSLTLRLLRDLLHTFRIVNRLDDPVSIAVGIVERRLRFL